MTLQNTPEEIEKLMERGANDKREKEERMCLMLYVITSEAHCLHSMQLQSLAPNHQTSSYWCATGFTTVHSLRQTAFLKQGTADLGWWQGVNNMATWRSHLSAVA